MRRVLPAVIATGLRARCDEGVLKRLFLQARERCPRGFPADETRALDALREQVSLGFVARLAQDLSEQLALPAGLLSLDRFTIQGAGPVSLHEDRRNYPNTYFILIVAHAGGLGVVDAKSRAEPHAPGDIVLLDPYRRHALVPHGRRARDWRCAPPDSFASEPEQQFLFLDFEVNRRATLPLVRARFGKPRSQVQGDRNKASDSAALKSAG